MWGYGQSAVSSDLMIIAIYYRREIRIFDQPDADLKEAMISAITRVLGRSFDLPELELLTPDEIVDHCLDYEIYVTNEVET